MWFDLQIDQFRPPLGYGPTAVVIAGLVMLVVRAMMTHVASRHVSITRWLTLWGIRLAGLAAVVWMLLGPSVACDEPAGPRGLPVVMLVDTSASMTQRDGLFPIEPPPERDVTTSRREARWISRFGVVASHWLDDGTVSALRNVAGDVSCYTFGERLAVSTFNKARNAPLTAQRTNLFAAIEQVIDQHPTGIRRHDMPSDVARTAGVLVVLSDGHDTQRVFDATVADKLVESGWKVVSVPLGTSRQVRDVFVIVSPEAEFVHDGQSTTIVATLNQWGYDRQQVDVELRDDAGHTIELQRVTLSSASSPTVRFRVTPMARPRQAITVQGYQVVARPLEGERVTDNNAAWAFIKVSKQGTKVGLFEGQPYWDTRYLADVLRDDPTVHLTAMYALGRGRTVVMQSISAHRDEARVAAPRNDSASYLQAAQGAPAPEPNNTTLRIPDLKQFDVIILGKHVERFFPGDEAHRLVDYVSKHGGAIIMARGKAFDVSSGAGAAAQRVFDVIEPVEWGANVINGLGLSVTDAGRANPLTSFDPAGWDAVEQVMPNMLAATQIRGSKAATVVMLTQQAFNDGESTGAPDQVDARSTPMAAMTYHNVGAGRVFAVLTDGLWQWAIMPPEMHAYEQVYHRFWSRALHWLASGGEFLPGQALSIDIDRTAVGPGEMVNLQVALRFGDDAADPPMLYVDGPRGKRSVVKLTRVDQHGVQYAATFTPDASGVYEFVVNAGSAGDTNTTTRLAVRERNGERLDASARPHVLAQLSETTGGICLGPAQVRELIDFVRDTKQAQRTQARIEYAFAQSGVLVAVCALFGSQWFLQRRWGFA
jgi:hypothetical protein